MMGICYDKYLTMKPLIISLQLYNILNNLI